MNKNIMRYFKSIQTFIRSLFYKQQEQTKQNKCTLQQEKYLKIGANICNIGFKSKHAYKDWQEDIFNQISVGDLVYCTMPVTDKALKSIPEGHTTRPFLIVKKGKGQLSANELAGFYKPKLTSLSASSTTLRENI